MINVLSGVHQKKKKTLWEYNDQFNKVVVEVEGSDDDLNCWKFQQVLRTDYMFRENLGLKGVGSMGFLLTRDQP